MPSLYQEVRSVVDGSIFRPHKRLGQNFLIDERVIDAVLRLLDLSAGDDVIEIGPGLGFLTRRLAEAAGNVWAVEIDRFLFEWLKQSALARRSNVHLVHGDILNISLSEMLPRHKIKLAGNLPYSIATETLFRLLDSHEHFSSLVLMVQKEVAERIAARPGTKSYGTLSVWVQLYGRIAGKVQVSSEAFFPRPKVRSTILRIELFSEPPVSGSDLPTLRRLIRAAFGQRRKTLANALSRWLNLERGVLHELLRAQDIDPKQRGETLSVDAFVRLARALERHGLGRVNLKP